MPTPDDSPFFVGLELDDRPDLLEASFRLRYQVYCHERRFLSPSFYPDERETDMFDAHAVHLGVVDRAGELVATTRLVRRTQDGLPMFGHCSVLLRDPVLADPDAALVEVSRLCVSRRYNRRQGDAHYALEGGTAAPGGRLRRAGGEIVMTLCRAAYQTSKRRGFQHWLAATERSLQRLLTAYRLPFRQVGPPSDYFGLVAPYLMHIADFDAEILSGQLPALQQFLDDLDPRFHPHPHRAS